MYDSVYIKCLYRLRSGRIAPASAGTMRCLYHMDTGIIC